MGRFNIWSQLNTILLVLFFVTWGLRSSTKHTNTGIETITLRKYEPEDYWYVGSKGLLQEPHPVEGLGSSTKYKNTGIKTTTLRKYEPEDYWYVGS